MTKSGQVQEIQGGNVSVHGHSKEILSDNNIIVLHANEPLMVMRFFYIFYDYESHMENSPKHNQHSYLVTELLSIKRLNWALFFFQ